MGLENELLKQLEDDILNNKLVLPTLPEIAIRVRQLLDGEWSVPQLAKEIQADPALMARLIKVANSAIYRPSRTIEDINGAIARLGRNLIRSLVTQLALLQSMQCYSSELSRHVQTINEHCLEVGAVCRGLAKAYTKLNPEQAMLAGLVHDIGKLPLLQRLGKLGQPLEDPEVQDAVQKLHPRIGALILKTWKFPAELITAAAEHDDLARDSAEIDYADLVLVANLQYHRRRGHSPYADLIPGSIPAMGKFDMDAEELLASDLSDEAKDTLEGFSS